MASAMWLRMMQDRTLFRIVSSITRGAETFGNRGSILNLASSGLFLKVITLFVRVRAVVLMLKLALELLFQMILSIVDFLL
jgi:hypothetical protein